MNKIIIFLFLFFTANLPGFTQYHISKESLKTQFLNSSSERHIFVTGNDLKKITCLDKSGLEHTIDVTNRTGIRIIQNDKTKKTFYLNTLIITDSTISGSKTHFFKAQITPIKFEEIAEIQIME